MSDYYDLFLAVDLVPGLPGPVLAELRWLLGQGDRPAEPVSADWESWGGPWQAFDGGTASHAFDGADVSLLVRAVERPDADGGEPWALTVRTCVHEDDFGIMMEVVEWLLRYATTRGWAGYVRDSGSGRFQHLVCHEDGFELADVRVGGERKRVARSARQPGPRRVDSAPPPRTPTSPHGPAPSATPARRAPESSRSEKPACGGPGRDIS